MGLIRSLISLALLAAFVFFGLTVPIGQRTLFGHVANIWSSDEAQELVEGVKDSSGPLVDRVKRGVEAGLADEGEGANGAQPTEGSRGQEQDAREQDAREQDAQEQDAREQDAGEQESQRPQGTGSPILSPVIRVELGN